MDTMNKPTIWIFSLEPIQTRYTCEWHAHIPRLLRNKVGAQFNVVQVDGIQKNSQVTPGAFLNFSDTNYWKSSQLCNFLDHYNQGLTSTNDHFIFTDAWNPTVVQLKYMSSLLDFNWKLHSLWHAGSYDPQDFLGSLIGNASWVRNAEKSFYESYDHNYFATKFHIKLFVDELLMNGLPSENPWYEQDIEFVLAGSDPKIVHTGWPMEYMGDTLASYATMVKRDLILFPHRIAPEKQVDIFRQLATLLPQYEFVVCQDKELTKNEYHTLLGQAKIVFSANLQETLGISTCAEGPLVNAIPLAPDRLSYTEMFEAYPEFLYPSEWSESMAAFNDHKDELVAKIKYTMDNYELLLPVVSNYVSTDYPKYFHADVLINNLK